MSKVLVTGAGGFIGSHLVERLVAEGRHVRAFVEYDSRGSWGWLDDVDTDTRDAIEVIAGDIRDSHAVRQAMTGCDTVFHLAAHLDAIGEVHGETLINRETGAIIRALVPVHCYGHPANMSALADIAARFGLTVVEDAAESLGSGIGDTHTGRFGRVGAFSFNGNKTITTGGGGALITDDDLLARRLRHLTTTARVNDGDDLVHDMVAYNYRMPNINAALGCAQLEGLDDLLAAKQRLADQYATVFGDLHGARYATAPSWGRSNNWLCGLVFDDPGDRDAALRALTGAGYASRPFWAPLHRMPMYAHAPRAALETTERLSACGLTLPSGAGLAGEIDR